MMKRFAFLLVLLGLSVQGLHAQESTSASSAAVDAAVDRFLAGEWQTAVDDLERLIASDQLTLAARTKARKFAALGHVIIEGEEGHDDAIRIFKDLVDDDASFGIPDLALPGEQPEPEAVRLLGQAFFEWRQEEAERLHARLSANTRSGTLLRSLAVPGWGQRYQGHRARSWAILGLAAGSVTYAVLADRSYRDARDAYDGAGIGEDFDTLYQDYRDKADTADLAVGLIGAVWALNLLDAAVSSPNISGLSPVSVAPRRDGGVQVSLRQSF